MIKWFIVDRILKIMGTTIVTTETQSLRHSTSCIPDGTDYKNVMNRQADSGYRIIWSQIVWRNVIVFIYVHLAAFYAVYLAFTKTKGLTLLWGEYLYSNVWIHHFFIYFTCLCICMYGHCFVYIYMKVAGSIPDEVFFFKFT
jgi:hypothetical protein